MPNHSRLSEWRWAITSDGPGRAKLMMTYRGGPELVDEREIKLALLKLVWQTVRLVLNRPGAMKRERDL